MCYWSHPSTTHVALVIIEKWNQYIFPSIVACESVVKLLFMFQPVYVCVMVHRQWRGDGSSGRLDKSSLTHERKQVCLPPVWVKNRFYLQGSGTFDSLPSPALFIYGFVYLQLWFGVDSWSNLRDCFLRWFKLAGQARAHINTQTPLSAATFMSFESF